MDTRTCYRLIALFFILTSTACRASQSAPDPTLVPATQASAPPTAIPTITPIPVPAIAKVNGTIIPLAEYEAEVIRFQQAQEALGKTVSAEEAEERVLNDLIDQTLLAQAAEDSGFTLTDEELNARVTALTADVGGEENLSTWLSSHGYTLEAFLSSLRKSISAGWMRDQIIAGVPSTAEQVHAQQILLYNRETAEDVLSKLSAGTDFGDLASAYDPKTNGELFWFPRNYLLEQSIESAAFSLDIGVPSEIIETEVGFHIIMVLEKAEDRPLSPDALLALQENALKEWLQKAREASKIER